MEKKFLIRMMTWDKEKDYPVMIKGFCSDEIAEFLKFYATVKKYEVPIEISCGSSCYDGHEAYVEDIKTSFGGDDELTALDIYVEVI